MKRIKKYIPLLATTGLVAVGALLPYMVSAGQDQNMETQVDRRQMEIIPQLSEKEQKDDYVKETLMLRANADMRVRLEKGTKLSGDEAAEAAVGIMELLQEEKLIPTVNLQTGMLNVNPFLVVSTEGDGNMAIIWDCMWNGGGEETYVLTLDDATGKLISFGWMGKLYYEAGEIPTAGMSDNVSMYKMIALAEDAGILAERWAQFCRSYYDFDSVSVREGDAANTFVLELTDETEERREKCELTLLIQDQNIFFN